MSDPATGSGQVPPLSQRRYQENPVGATYLTLPARRDPSETAVDLSRNYPYSSVCARWL